MELLPNGSSDEQRHMLPYEEDPVILEVGRNAYSPLNAAVEESSGHINVGQLARKYWLLVLAFLVLGAAGGFASVVLSLAELSGASVVGGTKHRRGVHPKRHRQRRQ